MKPAMSVNLPAAATCVVIAFSGQSIASAGSLVAWGADSHEQVTSVPIETDFVGIAAGWGHGVALKADGSIVGWGRNDFLQADAPSGNHFMGVAAGDQHSLAIEDPDGDGMGSLIAWGYDSDGQVSDLPSGTDFVAVAGGVLWTLALKADGSLEAWGYDGDGQVSGVPTENGFVAIAAGYHHGLAISDDGTIEQWGSGHAGWEPAPTSSDFVAIAAGHGFSVAIEDPDRDGVGQIVVWGHENYEGILDPPVGDAFTAVSATLYTAGLAPRAGGSLAGWGENGSGETDVPAGNNFVAVDGGGYWALGLSQPAIPTVSEWGMVVLALLLLVGMMVVLRTRRTATG